ncbi:recombinase RecT [Candidatus Borreliella tachyglossi]|uniref:recombinase RecT n=1 Tax=Candidatus Borreliella tachyglossi TaxID=1964448 RepID=UPI00404245FC
MKQLAQIKPSQYENINLGNTLEVWEAYKSQKNLTGIDARSESDIITLLMINKLNPFTNDVHIIPFKGTYTVVISYLALMRKAYEAGYDSKDLKFKEEQIMTLGFDASGNAIEKSDWQCTASLTTSAGKTYSYSVLLSEFSKNTPIWREKPIFMIRKCAISRLFRTLPNSCMQNLPYIAEELQSDDVVDVFSNSDKQQNNKQHCLDSRYSLYKNLLNFARLVVSQEYIEDKPFESARDIQEYMEFVEQGDDVLLLDYFNQNEQLKNIKYWTDLIKVYFMNSNKGLVDIQHFDNFLEKNKGFYGSSPLKLFGCLSRSDEFAYLTS